MQELDTVLSTFASLGPAEREAQFIGPFLFIQIPGDPKTFDPLEETAAGHLVRPSLGSTMVRPMVVNLGEQDTWTVGRWDTDIALPHPSISRNHAKLLRQLDGSYVVIDEGSSNLSVIEGQPIKPGKFYFLSDGARIFFGVVRCKFHSGKTFRKVLERMLERRG